MVSGHSLGSIVSSIALAPFGTLPLWNNASVQSNAPAVHIDGVGSYSGIVLSQSLSGFILPQNVDAWLGMDYASQPVGERRFQPIQGPPESFDGTKLADSFGPICMQDQAYPYSEEQSESCLNFNVYRPSHIPLSQKLPTLVWIHGGGFVLHSGRSMDGASFVASSKLPIMVVTFNYRLSAFGFLPSRLFERLGLLNLGLRDQYYLMEFLHRHLESFGGDPKQITLGGLSAGSHSTAFQYFHNYGTDEDKPLFARALLQSGAPTARAFPVVDYPRYQADFETLMKHIGCHTESSDEDQIACLRQSPAGEIEKISSQIYAEAEDRLNWPWQPTLGGERLERRGSECSSKGTFHHLPIITTYTTDEGKYYTPGTLETNDDFIEFWHNISPHLNRTDLAILNELYPDPVAHADSPWAQSPNSSQYNRISASWSDMAYICPSRSTAVRTSAEGVPTWRLRFNTPSYPLDQHSWKGIPHASDMTYLWNEQDVPFTDTARIYHAYMASFVAVGNPNDLRLEGSVEWPRYEKWDQSKGQEPQQLVVNPGNFTVVEADRARILQCDFWNAEERAIRLNK